MRSALLAGTILASGVLSNAVVELPAHAAVAPAMGPVDPATNFPSWYGDSNGTRLELCLDGPPNCLAAASELVAPDGEAFWYDAESDLPTSGGKTLMVLATEAAFAADGVGQESVFNRARFRVNTTQAGTFTITWPYGQKTYQIPLVDPKNFEINDTVDLGCFGAPPDNTCNDGIAPDFTDVLATLPPFLQWDPAVAPAPPPGFIGDAATPHKVTGSPTGNNVFRIQGPGINPTPSTDGCPTLTTPHNLADCLENSLFVVQGKLAGPLASTPAKVALGTNDLGVTSSQSVTLTNLGTTPLTVSRAVIDPASTNAADFAVTGNTCAAALARDATCTVTVSFTPSATGARSGSLLVTHDQVRSPLRVPLSGFGRLAATAPIVSLSPTSLSFGTLHVGTTSAPQRVTVTNTGTATLNISKVATGGTNPGEFLPTADCIDQSLAPGASCPIDVVFAPAHGGARSASLLITDDAANSPQSVPLGGTGDPGLVAVGPIDPVTHFPTWYQDKNGVRLENCLQGPPNCLTAAADLTPPDGESFYFDAESTMPLPAGGTAGLVLATEAAYAGEGVGQEITFNRIRFRANAGLRAGAEYKVTHPYGVDSYTAGPDGSVTATGGTEDIGCAGAPCDFSQLMSSRVGPFLTWDPAVAPAPPVGFIGDAATPHKVVGSPFGTNIFRIEGPDVNPNPLTDACPTLPASAKDLTLNPDYSPANCIETNLFVVQGKIAAAVAVPAAPTGLAATAGNAQVALSWTASTGATSYNVKRATVSGGPYTTVGSPTSASFTDTTVANGTTYFYVVSAVNSAGESANSTQASATPTAPVTGTPAASVSPATLTFRPQKVGTTSAAQTVTLTNSGTADLAISSIAIGGANATSFARTTTCGATLAAKASCTISVTVTPVARGALTANLTITDSAGTQTVRLSGRGN